jgi:AraC family transcriptional regulator, activator of mtrCDE
MTLTKCKRRLWRIKLTLTSGNENVASGFTPEALIRGKKREAMDALSRLLSLHPLRTVLDTRCCGAMPWSVDHVARSYGTAPYHLIVEGGARLVVDGHQPVQLVAGDMLVLPRGHAHTLHVGAGLPDTTITDILCGQFHFGAAATSTLIDALPDIMLVRSAGHPEFVSLQVLVSLLRDESSGFRPGASAVVLNLASALFALILRAWLEQADAVPGLFALLTDPRLAAALHAMLATPEKAWSMEQLAQLCHMSRSTFLRAFRKVAATTPGELLVQIRMAQAAQWLKQAHRGIGEIGEAVGYQSEAAFNRAFKRYMGAGPGQYRRAGATDTDSDHPLH